MKLPNGIVIKIIALILIILVVLAFAWYGFLYICNKKNEATEKQISNLISLLEDYYYHNKNYPDNIEIISEGNNISSTKVLLFFSTPTIRYQMSRDGFKIYYREAPFGPFYGYDSTKKEWYSEE